MNRFQIHVCCILLHLGFNLIVGEPPRVDIFVVDRPGGGPPGPESHQFILDNIQITPIYCRDLCRFLNGGYGNEPRRHAHVGPA